MGQDARETRQRWWPWVVAALALAPIAAALAFLASDGGQRRLAAIAAAQVNERIAGRIEVERIGLGLRGIRIEGLSAYAPGAAEPAIEAEVVQVAPAVAPGLLRGRVRILAARVERPRVRVELDEAGSSLARAFAPRAPAADGGAAGDWAVAIDDLVVEGGALHVRRGDEVLLALEDLAIDVAGDAHPGGAAAVGRAEATLLAPRAGAVGVELDATLADGWRGIDVRRFEARFRGSTVRLAGAGDLGAGTADARGLRLRLLPEDAAILLSAWRPTAPLRVEGGASLADGAARATLVVVQERDGDTGRLDVDARFVPAARRWELRLDGAAIDPRGLDARAPAGAADLRAVLEGTGAEAARGTIEIPALRLGDGTAGPIEATGRWEGEALALERLDAVLPGARLRASGAASAARGDLRFELAASDLVAARRSLSRLAAAAGRGIDLPALRGDLHLAGRLRGRWKAPSVEAVATSRALGVGDLAATALRAEARLDDLPAAPRGAVRASAATLATGAGQVRALEAALRVEGAEVRGTLEGRTAAGPVRARLDLLQRDAFRAAHVRRLDLDLPRARWRLERPFDLALDEGARVRGLALRSSAGGRIAAEGGLSRGALDLDLRIEELALAHLPPAVAPAELGLAGALSARARLEGRPAAPTGTVDVALRDAAFLGVDRLGVDAALRLEGRAAQVRVAAVRGATRVDAEAALPWPLSDRAPIEGTVQIADLDLRDVAAIAGLDEALAGRVHGEARIAGTIAAPQGLLDLRGEGLAARGIEDAAAAVRATFAEAIDVELEATHAGARLSATGRVEGSLRDPAALARAPARAQVRVEGAQLGWLMPRTEGAVAVRGLIALDAALEGSLLAPRGTVALGLADTWSGDIGPLDATLTLHAEAARTRLDLDARLLGRPFVSGAVEAGAPIERLADVASRPRTPVQGALSAADLELASVAWATGLRRRVRGLADGTLQIGGTIGDPVVDLEARLRDLALRRSAVGALRLEARYAARALDASVLLEPAGGGSALVEGRWLLDLAPAAIAAGSLGAFADAPLDLRLDARDLDLGFLAALSPDLHQSEGRLDGEVRVRGAPPLPTLEGALALRGGRFGYTGYGELRDVAFALELAPDALELRRLEATAGGRLEARVAARRRGGGPWAIEGAIEARRFALTTSDLVRGWLDLDAAVQGALDRDGLELRVDLERTEIELADTPPKDVQSLEPHPDFVVVRDGVFPPSRDEAPVRGPRRAFPAMIQVVTARPIEVEGTDVDLQASTDLKLLLAEEGLEMVGAAQVEGGYVVVLGRRFEFERGRIYYTGAEPPADPRLDVVARHESPYALVTVTVGGTVQRPTTNLRSNPPYSEAQIAELLATGRLQGGSVGGASGAASALGTVLAAQMKRGIASKLPLDVIAFEAGEEGDPFAGSRLEAGSWLTDRIYLGYARRFETSSIGLDDREPRNANEVRIEYQLGQRWSLEVTWGDAHVGGADLVWTRDF